MSDKEKIIRGILTVILVLGIVLLIYVLNTGLKKEGIETKISSVEDVEQKDTPIQKETKPNDTIIVLPEPPVEVEEEKPVEDTPSIIVDKPIRRDEETGRNDYKDEERATLDHQDGDIVNVLDIVEEIPDDSTKINTKLQEALKLQEERRLRNPGRILSGIEVASFSGTDGLLLDMTNILDKNTVVIPWDADNQESIKNIGTLESLYNEYKGKLNVIFLCANYKDKTSVEEIMSANNLNFKNYFDDTFTFLAYVESSGKTDIILINKDSYVVDKLSNTLTMDKLKENIDKLLSGGYDIVVDE